MTFSCLKYHKTNLMVLCITLRCWFLMKVLESWTARHIIQLGEFPECICFHSHFFNIHFAHLTIDSIVVPRLLHSDGLRSVPPKYTPKVSSVYFLYHHMFKLVKKPTCRVLNNPTLSTKTQFIMFGVSKAGTGLSSVQVLLGNYNQTLYLDLKTHTYLGGNTLWWEVQIPSKGYQPSRHAGNAPQQNRYWYNGTGSGWVITTLRLTRGSLQLMCTCNNMLKSPLSLLRMRRTPNNARYLMLTWINYINLYLTYSSRT